MRTFFNYFGGMMPRPGNRQLLDNKIAAVVSLFNAADRETSHFRKAAGLRCLPRCGKCCESNEVEVSVLEMLPLARELFRNNSAGFWIKTARPAVEESCVFYRPDSFDTISGRCPVYRYRPLICRLFGFSGTLKKNGAVVPALCSVVKNADPSVTEKCNAIVSAGKALPPKMTDYMMKLYAIDGSMAFPKLLINEALIKAIEYIGIRTGRRRKGEGPTLH